MWGCWETGMLGFWRFGDDWVNVCVQNSSVARLLLGLRSLRCLHKTPPLPGLHTLLSLQDLRCRVRLLVLLRLHAQGQSSGTCGKSRWQHREPAIGMCRETAWLPHSYSPMHQITECKIPNIRTCPNHKKTTMLPTSPHSKSTLPKCTHPKTSKLWNF